MSRMKWDQIGERLFETGLDHGVLFPMGNNGKYAKGVPWNGLSAVNETPSGGEPNAVWADNIKYLNLMSAEDFGATVEAYTYPPEFEECDGSAEVAPGVTIGQQIRKMFGLSYRTLIGNDVVGQNYGYKLHLVYGAQASPSEKNRQTVNDSPEATAMSWSLTTTPVDVPGYKATAHMTIDSTKTDKAKLAAFEDIIYGKDADGDNAAIESRLPMPEEVIAFFKEVPSAG